ncbi:MAG: hypothetical protein WED85_00270 [Dehalococcoidia bacterium]
MSETPTPAPQTLIPSTPAAAASATCKMPAQVSVLCEIGPAPTFDELSSKVDAAVAAFTGTTTVGGTLLPAPFQSVDQLHQTLGWCAEQGLEGAAPELYANAVLNGCLGAGQELRNMYYLNSSPAITEALNGTRDFLLGDGGKLDDLVARKLPGINGSTFAKVDYVQGWFIPCNEAVPQQTPNNTDECGTLSAQH